MTGNPFIVQGYVSKQYFCDREDELNRLITSVTSGVNVTLIAPRRMGKTGLIMRLFDELDSTTDVKTIYVDIFATRNIIDFNKALSETILKKFPEKSSLREKFLNFLRGFRPLLSFDSITGDPQIQFNYQIEEQKRDTLEKLLEFIDNQDITIVVAIDEFQQIRNYPETNIEAILRSKIQHLKNVHFIFCGSKHHVMIDIFSNAKMPFYCSTQFLSLQKINKEIYADFIKNNFAKYGYIIDNDAVELILNWTNCYTYYTQSLCNLIFQMSHSNIISVEIVKESCSEILLRNESVYMQYRQILTSQQWNFLIALAKEEHVEKITSQVFVNKYNIGSGANAKRILTSLMEKDLVLDETSLKSTSYRVYDIFFAHWLDKTY